MVPAFLFFGVGVDGWIGERVGRLRWGDGYLAFCHFAR